MLPRRCRSFDCILTRLIVCGISVSVVCGAGGAAALAGGQDPNRDETAALRALYDNEARFAQLSGAARTLLERKFGRRLRPGSFPPIDNNPPDDALLSKPPVPGARTPATIVDPLVNNPALDTTSQDTQSESSIALGAGSNVIAAFNNSRVNTALNNHFTGFSHSSNGGSSWTDGGALPASANGDAGDPVLARDELTGSVFLATLCDAGSCVEVFRSSDNGSTWAAPVNAAPGFGGGDFLDKPWIAVDNSAMAQQRAVYVVFRNFSGGGGGSKPNGIYLTKSIDGGSTWGPVGGRLVVPADSTQGAWVVVDSHTHKVHVFWHECKDENNQPCGHMSMKRNNKIKVASSLDFGDTFGNPTSVAPLLGVAQNGDLAINGGFRTNSFPQAAINRANGDMYAVYNDLTIPATATLFSGFAYGQGLMGGVLQATDGNFYGTTSGGGTSNLGTVFMMTPAGVVTILHSFAGGADGWNPQSGLVQGTDGDFYGTTVGDSVYNTTNGPGTAFKISPTGTSYSVLHSFGTWSPVARLIQASDGNFYGTTEYGGGGGPQGGAGTIFRMTPAGTVTVLHAFGRHQDGTPDPSDGGYPVAALIQATDGDFYGTTEGGALCCDALWGTVFRVTAGGAVTILHRFDASDGSLPFAPLIQAADGNFYGTTSGSTGGPGSAFKITAGGAITILHTFPFVGGSDGWAPREALLEATDGNLYGVTLGGPGNQGSGTVFRISTDGTVKTVFAFSGSVVSPTGPLIQGTDGAFYGTSTSGVFRLNGTGDVFFTRSSDSGATWRTPIVLNDDGTRRDQFMPAIAVTPNGAGIFVSWYDRRNDPNNLLIERWGVVGTITAAGINWGSNFRISSAAFPVVIGQDPAMEPIYMGDYDQAVADNSFFYATWGDNRGPSSAHPHQPDVRFAKIPAPRPAFTDDTLTPQVTQVKTVHISEIRSRIDALRAQLGLAPYNWTDPLLIPTATLIRAEHILDVRTALSQVYVAAGLTPPTYTDPALGPNTPIKAIHIIEIRAGIVAIE
jgi:uncharacterized repeat protein (TIGR03803 family)